MLTTLTIPHRTLGQFHSREEMKILLSARDCEHHYETIPQRPGPATRLIRACLIWLHHRGMRA